MNAREQARKAAAKSVAPGSDYQLVAKDAADLASDLYEPIAEDLLSTVAALRSALEHATMVDEDERHLHLLNADHVFRRSYRALRGADPS